jgi:hypothetical protein
MASSSSSILDEIPTYHIDLSLPPSDRYTELAMDFAPRMRELTPILDEVLSYIIPYARVRRFIQFLASVVLFRVFSKEETQELRGISKASGVQIYFLVALNVLLDSLLGCTSGGVLVTPKERKRRSKNERRSQVIPEDLEDRMMHFRTLDWGMDELRSVLVVLEFVRSKSDEPEKVLARSITYAGFVGCLTGVRYVLRLRVGNEYELIKRRENLSLSLNFRPNHHCSTRSLRWHQLLVLFGFRQSIISTLRHTLFTPTQTPLSEVTTSLSTPRSASCYLILCSGTETTVIEKDLHTSKIYTSNSFIVHTNHDSPTTTPDGAHQSTTPEKGSVLGLGVFLEESEDRRKCIQKKWNSLVKRRATKLEEGPTAVRENTLVGWIQDSPVMNEVTHFACLMDPKYGTIRWIKRGAYEEADSEEELSHFDPELTETVDVERDDEKQEEEDKKTERRSLREQRLDKFALSQVDVSKMA